MKKKKLIYSRLLFDKCRLKFFEREEGMMHGQINKNIYEN